MRKICLGLLFLFFVGLLLADLVAAARLKDIAHIKGVRGNQLVGYGLVVGLDGTGDDTKKGKFASEAMANMLDKFGISVDASSIDLDNTAAVMMTAELPPFSRNGSRLDILVSSIAATLASAIGMVANSMRWQGYAEGQRGGGLRVLLIAVLMPMAASLIHLGISRSREYMADESGAHASHDPLALASALQKLDASVKQAQLIPQNPAQATTASLYIVYPFTTRSLSNLFSTHPPMEQRIARLQRMAREMGQE